MFNRFAKPMWTAASHTGLLDMQMRCFVVSKQTRINRRLRKYRAEKIQREQSYNNQEGK